MSCCSFLPQGCSSAQTAALHSWGSGLRIAVVVVAQLRIAESAAPPLLWGLGLHKDSGELAAGSVDLCGCCMSKDCNFLCGFLLTPARCAGARGSLSGLSSARPGSSVSRERLRSRSPRVQGLAGLTATAWTPLLKLLARQPWRPPSVVSREFHQEKTLSP